MGWLILFLALALIVGFIWFLNSMLNVTDEELEDYSRSRKPTRRKHVPQPAAVELTGDYRLEWREGDEGGFGFVVQRKSDGQRLSWRTLPRSEGLESINVAGESHRKRQIQSESFAAGRPVKLVPEPDNEYDPNAIGIWDTEQRLQCGYIPADDAQRIGRKLEKGDIERAMVMWETHKNGQRVSLRLLLLGQGASKVPSQDGSEEEGR